MVVSASHFETVTNGYQQTTSGLWVHKGKLMVVGGPVELPDGAIGTSEIAAGAVQQLLGSYIATISWTLPSPSVWTETPLQVNVTCGGYLTRVEFALCVACPTKGQRVYWGVMIDGTGPSSSLGALDAPEANYGAMAIGNYYFTPAVGTHRLGVALYGPAGAAIANFILSTLYVTEQKR